MRAPWEDTVGPRDPGASRRLAAALTRWLGPWRWRVTPWPGGYALTGPCGALPPAGGVDEVVARAGAARPGELGRRLSDAPPDGLDLAEAVVRVSVLALERGHPVVLAGPDPGRARRLHAHGGVAVDVVPRPGAAWSVG
ncbi:hypothetical protein [Actinomycetospora cinnamomea]|uniref:hypothetical protein n=1 Tax=Actinomycetospora cinnamomea TaxID=663609 RepID=UPI000E317550|nr:hypothetical protein [Actinomycetospora cinnamomea]